MTNTEEVHKNSIPNTKEDILEDFKNFCKTIRELKEGTVKLHSIFVKKFLKHLGTRHPTELTERDISVFKETFSSSSPSVRANLIKAMRIFVRDYLKKGEEVKRFKLPTIKFVPKVSPTDEEIRAFYHMLRRPREKAVYLLLATSGLRKHELLSLRREDFDFDQRMIIPRVRNEKTGQVEGSQTKHQLVTFYNEEAAQALQEFLKTKKRKQMFTERAIRTTFSEPRRAKINLTPQKLRLWFCNKMGRLKVPDRYVDAYCGRSPQSVLGRHYTGYNELKQIYEEAGLKVLE